MSNLYEHRDQSDGLRHLVEIARWAVIFRVPPEDREDMEQELVIHLLRTVERYGNKGKRYLQVVARNGVNGYLRRRYEEEKRVCFFTETNQGEIVEKTGEFLHNGNDGDADARLDAIAKLATLPERLIEIGYKRLKGGRLSEAEQSYERRQKTTLRLKMNFRKYGNRLSDQEKKRILLLHLEGLSLCKITKAMGRTNRAVKRCLVKAGVSSLWPSDERVTAETKGKSGPPGLAARR